MTWIQAKQTPLGAKQGFTIVELLIVIVVIAVLAAITIVVYSNIQARAQFSRSQSDLKSIVKALELYKIDNNAYPISDDLPGCVYDWCGWDQAMGNDFIPGLSPKYMSTIPQMPSELANGDTYLYQGRGGTDYQLIRYKNNPQLPTIETQNNPLLATTDGYYNSGTGAYYAWGYKTNTGGPWW